jgi:hypothetical protein
MPSPTPITCTFIKLTAYSRWRSQLLPDSLTQQSGASAADSHQQSQTSAVFCSRHGMTSAAKLPILADAATQPGFSCLSNRRRHVPDSSTADPHAFLEPDLCISPGCDFHMLLLRSVLLYSLLLNKCLLMCILWNDFRNNPVTLYLRRLEPRYTAPTMQTPRISSMIGMARWRDREAQASMAS